MCGDPSEARMNEERPDAARQPPSEQHHRKRPYSRPTLTEYGSVSKLTQGSRTLNADGSSGGFRRQAGA